MLGSTPHLAATSPVLRLPQASSCVLQKQYGSGAADLAEAGCMTPPHPYRTLGEIPSLLVTCACIICVLYEWSTKAS